jgi:hypothetical protein
VSINLFEGYTQVLKESAISMSTLLIIILGYQLLFLKLPFKKLVNTIKGIIMAFIGLTLFLQGVNIGYIPIGRAIGIALARLPYNWVLIPIGFLLGYSVTLAEPSVQVLVEEIEKVTGGFIKRRIMLLTLCSGVAVAFAISILKILHNISLWYFIIPGYIIALLLSCITSERFTAIAFDSGGVATGTMTVTFLLSLAIGVAESIEGANPIVDGFGIMSLISLAPILFVLILGLVYEKQIKQVYDKNK